MQDAPPLTPDLVLRAYAAGVFPMAEARDDPRVFWVDPERRGVIPLDGLRISRSLARDIRRGGYRVRVDTDFAGVLAGCADRPETWINAPIAGVFTALHQMGHAHALEIWEEDILVGGVYGLALGAAFFGESMFSRRTNASKIALAWLVARLRVGGFTLFDTQFLTPHLARLGAVEIDREGYRARLADALSRKADFFAQSVEASAASVLQRSTQTS